MWSLLVSIKTLLRGVAMLASPIKPITGPEAALTTAKYMWNFLSGLAIKHKLPLQTAA